MIIRYSYSATIEYFLKPKVKNHKFGVQKMVLGKNFHKRFFFLKINTNGGTHSDLGLMLVQWRVSDSYLRHWEGNLLALSSSRLMTFNLITSTLSWHIQSMDRCRPPWRLPKEGGGHFQKTSTLGSAKNDPLYEVQFSIYFIFSFKIRVDVKYILEIRLIRFPNL